MAQYNLYESSNVCFSINGNDKTCRGGFLLEAGSGLFFAGQRLYVCMETCSDEEKRMSFSIRRPTLEEWESKGPLHGRIDASIYGRLEKICRGEWLYYQNSDAYHLKVPGLDLRQWLDGVGATLTSPAFFEELTSAELESSVPLRNMNSAEDLYHPRDMTVPPRALNTWSKWQSSLRDTAERYAAAMERDGEKTGAIWNRERINDIIRLPSPYPFDEPDPKRRMLKTGEFVRTREWC
ncbi:hypothetical protein GGR57DRAFT_466247 [Xylariaceae sp. FL1272]|nr:hypothetical protein GGR57DRAFT_466247 [Xylariaceae sp. FL1272]